MRSARHQNAFRQHWMGVAVLVAGALAGCNPATIRGRVLDVKGDPLPGVAVTLEGTDIQALTDATGSYTLRLKTGRVELTYAKTGYTPGRVEAEISDLNPVEVTPAVLWPLPLTTGVFLFEDYRYRETTSVHPQRYVARGGDVVFGTEKWPGLEVLNGRPVIIFHNMPRYGARLCKLALVDVVMADSSATGDAVQLWKRSERVPAASEAIDGPQGSLVQLRFDGVLEPGSYAIHWGALDGDTRIDQRMFLFGIGESVPELPPQSAPSGEPSEEAREGPNGEGET